MHSVLNNLNSDPKVHFWVSFGILTYKSNSILRMFSDLIIVGNPVLRSKVVDVAPNPHLNQVKRALKAAYPPVCCSWWRAHSFHHVLQAADWPASALDRFSMTGRYGTRYAAPSLSRPKCCFSPLLLSFEKTVLHRQSVELFYFSCELKNHVFQNEKTIEVQIQVRKVFRKAKFFRENVSLLRWLKV